MTRLLLAGIWLIALAGLVPGQEGKADDRVKVDVLLSEENVPKGLKAGNRVDLKMVTGKSITPKGVVSLNTVPVAPDLEVASVTNVEKPATPLAAVKVQLLVPKDLAAKVEKTRDRMVSVVERTKDGGVVRKMIPVILRLELRKADEK
jgi:hypothetical protein